MVQLEPDGMAKMSVLAGIGLALASAGFVYGVVAVGVPAQDPTPAQAAAERFNLALSGWAMAVGGVVMVAGIIGMAVAAARRASGRGV
jgi:heme/copper-type cytochrome/quinol oxidase subunit 2